MSDKFIVAKLEDGASASIFVREIIAYHSTEDNNKTLVFLKSINGHFVVDAPKKRVDEAILQLLANISGNLHSVSLIDPMTIAPPMVLPDQIASVPYRETTEDDVLAEITALLK